MQEIKKPNLNLYKWKCLQYLRDYKLKDKAILDVEDDEGGY